MLKKKNLFVAILSFFFCFSMMLGVSNVKEGDNQQNLTYAAETSPMPDFSDVSEAEDGSWTYDTETLTIKGVNWNEQLYLPNGPLIIKIEGENHLTVAEDEAIIFDSGSSITFTGSGQLFISAASNAFDTTDVTKITLGDGVNIKENIANSKPVSDMAVSKKSADSARHLSS